MPTLRPYRNLPGILLILLTWLLQPAVFFAQRPFTCEDQFFLTLSAMPTSLNEVLIDPKTNAVVFKPLNASVPFDVNAAGFRTTDNLIYCVNPEKGTLVRFDANGQAQVLAQLPLNLNRSYFAGDVTPDGRYLVIIGTQYFVTGLAQAVDLVRIDLTDPNYSISALPINRPARIFDIAFHPVTGELYAYDSETQRLLLIDPNTGALSYKFPPSNVPVNTGSLFFDAYSHLFAYGSPTLKADQNSLYRIDPQSGASTLLFTGPPADASDGCSCPYTIELSKTVTPRTTFPCTDVEYTFEIINTSNRPHEGIRLEDKLPPGFTFVSVKSNPLGGNLLSKPGDTVFQLDDVDLPAGRYKITIVVNTGHAPPGDYLNQATLYNLPASLGNTRISDDTTTAIKDDSTRLTIRGFSFDTLYIVKALCEGSGPVRLDAGPYAPSSASGPVTFSWPDGNNSPSIEVDAPGEYPVTLAAGCDSAFIIYTVKYSDIHIEIVRDESLLPIRLGDSLYLKTDVFNTGDQTIYQWFDPQPGSVRCPTCPETWVKPFNNIDYTVQVQNELGCTDTASVQILVDKNKRIWFPNGFKPDADNPANGTFYPSGDSYTVIADLSVFSRWGERLFQRRDMAVNDSALGWDGTFRGELMPPGVYTWVAEIIFLDGERVVYSGDVTLVR